MLTRASVNFLILCLIILNGEIGIDDSHDSVVSFGSFTTFNGILTFNDDRNHNGGSGLSSLGSNTYSTSEIIDELKDYLTHYIISHEIGKGAYGRVFKAFRTIDGQFVAIKILIKSSETINDYEINSKIKGHTLPNLVQTIVTYECENFYIIIMNLYKQTLKSFVDELIENDTLHDNLELLITLILKIFHQITNGILNLREINDDKPVGLFDIKPENIYIDENGDFHAADLGLADTEINIDTVKGSPLYISRAFASLNVTDQIVLDTFDINSLSLTCWEIISRSYPPLQSIYERVRLQYQEFGVLPGINNRDQIIMEEWKRIGVNNSPTLKVDDTIKKLYEFILEFGIFDSKEPTKYTWINFQDKLKEIVKTLHS